MGGIFVQEKKDSDDSRPAVLQQASKDSPDTDTPTAPIGGHRERRNALVRAAGQRNLLTQSKDQAEGTTRQRRNAIIGEPGQKSLLPKSMDDTPTIATRPRRNAIIGMDPSIQAHLSSLNTPLIQDNMDVPYQESVLLTINNTIKANPAQLEQLKEYNSQRDEKQGFWSNAFSKGKKIAENDPGVADLADMKSFEESDTFDKRKASSMSVSDMEDDSKLNVENITSGVITGILTLAEIGKNIYLVYTKSKKNTDSIDLVELIQQGLKLAKSSLESVQKILTFLRNPVALQIPIYGNSVGIAINFCEIFLKYVKYKDAVDNIKDAENSKIETFEKKYKSAPFVSIKEGKVVIDATKLSQRKKVIENDLNDPDKQSSVSDATMTELNDITEYTFYQDMVYINKKNRTRTAIVIAENIVSTAAEVAKIIGVATGGAGIGVGVAMQGAVATEKAGRLGLRTIKQYGRDKGWSGFNKSKTTNEKLNKYSRNAYFILKGIEKLPNPYSKSVQAQFDNSKMALKMVNADYQELEKKSEKIIKVRSYLMQKMQERE